MHAGEHVMYLNLNYKNFQSRSVKFHRQPAQNKGFFCSVIRHFCQKNTRAWLKIYYALLEKLRA